VLTALACEYAGRVPVSPPQLLRGLSRRLLSYSASVQEVILLTMMRLAAECQKIPPEPISDVQHLKSISGRHISRVCVLSTLLSLALIMTRDYQRCSQFEDMIGKADELRAAVANSRSRSLPDFLLALESKPPALPRSPRLDSSSRTTSRSSLSGTQKLRYAAYEPPPPAQPRRPRAASSTRSTTPLDSYDDLSRTVTAGDLAIAAGSPELRTLSPPAQTPPVSPAPKPKSTDLLVRALDSMNLDARAYHTTNRVLARI